MNTKGAIQRIRQTGFTLVELIVTLAIFVTLIGLATINLVHTQRHSSLSSTTTQIITTLKDQQLRAMIGDTEGRGTSDDYGIYFEPTKYTLFHGSVYTASDPSNFSVQLDSSLQFTTAGTAVIFTKISGDIVGYSGSPVSITLTDMTNNETQTIQLNRLGVVTQVN